MKNSYRILGTSLLTLGLVGCFEVPDQDHLVTAAGIVPGVDCQKPPLVALATTALPREFGITVWNLYKGQRKNWREGLDEYAKSQDLVLLQARRIGLDEVLAELDRREGTSGIEEKASRSE